MGLKIPTIFKKKFVEEIKIDSVINEVNTECEWLFKSGGIPTLLIKGIDILVKGGIVHRKLHLNTNKEKSLLWIKDIDIYSKEKKGKTPGWIPVSSKKDDKIFVEAHINWLKTREKAIPDGIYKLIGPKINGNKYELKYHYFVSPYSNILTNVPLDYFKLFDYMSKTYNEGIIWLQKGNNAIHLTKRAKIERKDFLFIE